MSNLKFDLKTISDSLKAYLEENLNKYNFIQESSRDPIFFFKNGNKIKIKKENRGKFTDYCGGKVTSQCILKGKSSSDPKIRKRATFAENARKWKHAEGGSINKFLTGGITKSKTKVKEDILSDKDRKAKFLELNRITFTDLLKNSIHKKGITNVLLNEGYASNMINQRYSMNPDSLIINNNPSYNPNKNGIPNHKKLGNTGLDYISNEEAKLAGIPTSRLVIKKAFDNTTPLLTTNQITLRLAIPIIDQKLNNAKRALYEKYGPESVSNFFRSNPGSEDRLLYAGYKMPEKLNKRIKKHPNILSLYNLYILGGINHAFLQVDRYSQIINNFFNKK